MNFPINFWPIIFEMLHKFYSWSLFSVAAQTRQTQTHARLVEGAGKMFWSAVGNIISTWICNEIIWFVFYIQSNGSKTHNISQKINRRRASHSESTKRQNFIVFLPFVCLCLCVCECVCMWVVGLISFFPFFIWLFVLYVFLPLSDSFNHSLTFLKRLL